MNDLTPATPAASLTGRDRINAMKSRAKAKAKAAREKFHQRAAGWIHPQERVKVADRLIQSVIRRIEFPKYGDAFPLSATDKADAQAAGFKACVETGFFEHGFATVNVFKGIRNAIQSRDCLRLRCHWEYATGNDYLEKSLGMVATDTFEPRLTPYQRGAAKEVMRTLRAAMACDESRKAVSAFKSQRDFFLIVLGCITEKTPRGMNSGTFDTRKSRFLDYLAKGTKHLRTTRQAPPDLAGEIMQALADRALA